MRWGDPLPGPATIAVIGPETSRDLERTILQHTLTREVVTMYNELVPCEARTSRAMDIFLKVQTWNTLKAPAPLLSRRQAPR